MICIVFNSVSYAMRQIALFSPLRASFFGASVEMMGICGLLFSKVPCYYSVIPSAVEGSRRSAACSQSN